MLSLEREKSFFVTEGLGKFRQPDLGITIAFMVSEWFVEVFVRQVALGSFQASHFRSDLLGYRLGVVSAHK